jgi:hypothetical protein
MADFTAEQYRAAARAAMAAGDVKSANELIAAGMALGQTAPEAPQSPPEQPSLWNRIVDNVVGLDNGIMSPGEKIGTALNLGGEGLTLGVVGDEADAAARTLFNGQSYSDNLATARGKEAQLRAENPIAATAATILPSLLIPGGAIGAGGNLAARMGVGAAAGGAAGGLYGFMEGEGVADRVRGAKQGGLIGGGLGLGLPVAGDLARRLYERVRGGAAIRAASRAAPSMDDVERQASAIFQRNDQAAFPRADFQATADNMRRVGVDSGMDSMLTPMASRIAANADEMAGASDPQLLMRELNILRRQAAVPAGNVANRTESAIGSRMIDEIDNFVDTAAPNLGAEMQEARSLWSRLRRSDRINEAIARAETAASGFENGLQQEFRRILRNPKLSRGFSEAELRAIGRVVNGGVLHGLLRQVGRLGFSLDNGSNALGGALGAALGGAVGSIPGAVAATAAGTTARKLSEMLRTSAANRAAAIVRSPSQINLPVVSNAARTHLDDLLLRAGRAGSIASSSN